MRHFRAHDRIIEQVAGNRDLIGLKDAGRLIRVADVFAATFAVEWLVRVGDVHHQAERLARLLCRGDALCRGGFECGRVSRLGLTAFDEPIEHEVPRIRRIRCGMADFVANRGEVSGRFHDVGHHRIAGIGHLIKSFDMVVMRIAAREECIARWHAVGAYNVGVIEAHALRRQPIDIGRRIRELAAKRTERVGAQVIGSNYQHIEAVRRMRSCHNDSHGKCHSEHYQAVSKSESLIYYTT